MLSIRPDTSHLIVSDMTYLEGKTICWQGNSKVYHPERKNDWEISFSIKIIIAAFINSRTTKKFTDNNFSQIR